MRLFKNRKVTRTSAINSLLFAIVTFLFFLISRLTNYFFLIDLSNDEEYALYSVLYVFCFYFIKKKFFS